MGTQARPCQSAIALVIAGSILAACQRPLPTPTQTPLVRPLEGQYLFVEWRSTLICTGQSSPAYYDYPYYRFSPSTGLLEIFACGLGQISNSLQPDDWGFFGWANTASGGPCSGELSFPEPIHQLPYKSPNVDVWLNGVTADGTVTLRMGNEKMTLAPGRAWEQRTTEASENGTHETTLRLTNYGWHDRTGVICSVP